LKFRSSIILIVFILIIDQALKFWIKTHLYMGEEFNVIGHWFRIHFIENEGMAYGLSFGGAWGKVMLTLFRFIAVIFGFYLLRKITRLNYHKGLIICGAMILAGAMGNLIDSMFYGLIFSDSTFTQLAQFLPAGGGYAGFLHGKVVDMLYFPIYEGFLPHWIPFKGGDYFIFFQPVFNISYASISIGVITILLFQKKFFHHMQHRESLSPRGNATVIPQVNHDKR
jgi:signal peptidase II